MTRAGRIRGTKGFRLLAEGVDYDIITHVAQDWR